MGINSFIHKKSYEKVLRALRRHPITFVPALLLFIVLLILPVGLYFIISWNFSAWLQSEAGFTVLVLFGSAYCLSILLYIFTYFITFYLDVLIITNDRLVDIDQLSLFARTIAEVDLYQIQDATSEVKGIFPTLFNYGNLIIQTAGALPKFTLLNIRDPHHLRGELLTLAEEDRKYHCHI